MTDLERLLVHYGCDRFCYNNNDCNNCWFKQHVQYELDRMKIQHHDCKSETKLKIIMEKKKLFGPIRHGASSLPPDFTEELKEMEIEYPYPRKVDENKYEIAPGMYCNKIEVDEFFEEWKRTLGQKKKYCFDNIRFDVMNWSPEVRKTMTKQMIYMIPHGVTYWSDFEKGIIMRDYFGDVIDNYVEWNRQRE